MKIIKVGPLFSLKTASDIQKKAFAIPKPRSNCKTWKLWNILSLQAFKFTPTSGNSLVVCRVSPFRIIAPLFWKNQVPYQIKPRNLNLTVCIVFICVCWTENVIVSAGQLSLIDSRTYCGRSCCVKGACENYLRDNRRWLYCVIKSFMFPLGENCYAVAYDNVNDFRLNIRLFQSVRIHRLTNTSCFSGWNKL